MRIEILALLAASNLVQAIPIPFPVSFRLSPRWFQDSPPVSLVNRSSHRGDGGGGGDYRNAATRTGDITFVDPSGRPVATLAASAIIPQEATPTAITLPDPSLDIGSSSASLRSTSSIMSGMVGIVPAIGNNPGSSPPLTAFDSLPVPGSSQVSSTQNSTSMAQATRPSETAVASGGMVGIVPAIGNNPGSSPPLTAFPSLPRANPNTSPTSVTPNATSPVCSSSASTNVVYTTVMHTVTITRPRSMSSATFIANSTFTTSTPAPVPAVTSSSSGRSVDTFPLIPSQTSATAASSTPTKPGTLYTFSPSGYSSSPTSSSTPLLVLPSIQTVSPMGQSTITILPPNASTLTPSPVAGANSPQTSPGSSAMTPQAPAGLDGLSIVPIAGLPVVPMATPVVGGTGLETGAGTGTGTGRLTPVTVTSTASGPTLTVTATPTPTSSSMTGAPPALSTSSTALMLEMSRNVSASSTLTIPLPG